MAAKKKSDLELIEDFRKGDQSSFEELITRYSNKVHSLASRLTRNAEDAEEVLQDVFVTVYRKLSKFEGKSTFSSWLYRVTVNASFMKLRRRKHDNNISVEEVLPQILNGALARQASAMGGEGDKVTAQHQLSEALEDAISRLPDEYRPVFILRDVDGLSSREVGKILNISVPAVKSRLHRSRMMLRRKLSKCYQEFVEPHRRTKVANS
jgi:RNA polymerase sigma-70 factor (ECF subfamily)